MSQETASTGALLKAARTAAGISLSALQLRTHYSKSYLSNVENGRKPATREIIEAYERVLGVEIPGSEMERRALLAGLSFGVRTPSMITEVVRRGLVSALGGRATVEDWQEICEEHGRLCMTAPPGQMQEAISGDLLLLRQQLAEGDQPELRAVAARLATLLGMSTASAGDIPGAVRWYRTARQLADTTGDLPLRAWIRGREVLRSEYDGYGTPAGILRAAGQYAGLADTPSIGRMEIMVAAARAYAKLGERGRAFEALDEARRAYGQLAVVEDTQSMYYLPAWRFALRESYVYAVVGDSAAVDRILTEVARACPGNLPRWGAQVKLNHALAVAHGGDAGAALDSAIEVVAATPRAQHTQTMRQLVLGLCSAVPSGSHTESVVHLRGIGGLNDHS